MTRLVQLRKGDERRVAVVDEPQLVFLSGCESVYGLAREALANGKSLTQLVGERRSEHAIAYDPVYSGSSDWKLLPPADHPDEPTRCCVSGTGLTHLGSAQDRDAMHGKLADEENLSDSMRMFRWGVQGGKPGAGMIGIAPEWFYKGNGHILRAHNEPIELPSHAEDGGEEGELAGVYLIGHSGQPVRIGIATGNEYSDHKFEKRNYLNLAGSKLRACALGPELVVDPGFASVPGRVQLQRDGETYWSKEIVTGEENMCHSLANIEHHHFKFAHHRCPGDVHIHFVGACALSFGEGIELRDGDVMEVAFENYGRALRNPLRKDPQPDRLVAVQPLA